MEDSKCKCSEHMESTQETDQEGDGAPEIKHRITAAYILRDLKLPRAVFPARSLTQEHWLSVQSFLLMILVPRLSAWSKDRSLLSRKPFQ